MQSSDGSIGSPFPDIQLRDISVPEMLMLSMNEHDPNKIAFIDAQTERSYTFGEFKNLYKRISSALSGRGMHQGEVICFFSPNSLEFALMFAACITAGLVVSPSNFNSTRFELTYQLNDCCASYIFTTKAFLPVVKASLNSNIKEIFIADKESVNGFTSIFELALNDGKSFMGNNLKINTLQDAVIIPYSSGTTGLPKGVEITHRNCTAMLDIFQQPQFFGSSKRSKNDTTVVFLPFYHAYGLQKLLLNNLLQGVSQVIMANFVPELFYRCIQKYKPFTIALVPPIVNLLIKDTKAREINFTCLQYISCGASPLSKQIEEKFRSVTKIYCLRQGYGMTEATLAVTLGEKDSYKVGSTGRLVNNVRLKVIDQETGKYCGIGMKGELWFKGPIVMKGYLNRPKETRNCITEDGWLKTGDIGYFDKDGYVFIVAPAELESVLLTHPKIKDAGVVGIDDERAGQIPKAYVVKKVDNLTKKEINDYIADKLSDFKRLRGGIDFIEEIPRLPSGKVLRRTLRDLETKKTLNSQL
ncbi:DgyrCDS6865 [Dimorphilus gyrociliatus]|uniref:DgyrCDS6865 n=1 Tax=Dimorphilus gyrociliatus TaxID=2664684 RepID=A0A7I8VRY5_9ANNE|nr:DgyrCDS6865 [Dimorphilus gyrociliatus]